MRNQPSTLSPEAAALSFALFLAGEAITITPAPCIRERSAHPGGCVVEKDRKGVRTVSGIGLFVAHCDVAGNCGYYLINDGTVTTRRTYPEVLASG